MKADLFPRLAMVFLACTGLAACAAGLSGGTPDEAALTGGSGSTTTTGATAAGGYAMSDDEKGLDCKRLTGKIQIRILELRTYSTTSQTSALSRDLQSAQSVFGGSKTGIDPNGEHARDLAMIEAYNRQLSAKGCKSFDLARELAGTSTPEATVPAPAVATGPR